MKPAVATVQDDIPPVHVLEAAQHQDRKETEDLLAGFDRPGRSPKPASKERDFVDYYAKKKGSGADSGSSRPTASGPSAPLRAKQADLSTVIVHRKTEPMPPWVGWVGAAALMLGFGGIVAYLATTGEAQPTVTVPTGPSAATTITSAMSPQQANADNNIPPPAPADPLPTTTTTVTVVEPSPTAAPSQVAPRGPAKREPRNANGLAGSTPPHGTNATDDSKPPPRDDFIRDL